MRCQPDIREPVPGLPSCDDGGKITPWAEIAWVRRRLICSPLAGELSSSSITPRPSLPPETPPSGNSAQRSAERNKAAYGRRA